MSERGCSFCFDGIADCHVCNGCEACCDCYDDGIAMDDDSLDEEDERDPDDFDGDDAEYFYRDEAE